MIGRSLSLPNYIQDARALRIYAGRVFERLTVTSHVQLQALLVSAKIGSAPGRRPPKNRRMLAFRRRHGTRNQLWGIHMRIGKQLANGWSSPFGTVLVLCLTFLCR